MKCKLLLTKEKLIKIRTCQYKMHSIQKNLSVEHKHEHKIDFADFYRRKEILKLKISVNLSNFIVPSITGAHVVMTAG